MDNTILIEENDSAFGGIYNEWRIKRVKKLEQTFGSEWFNGKKILELGCGYGNIGTYFQNLGSDVTFADSRKECLAGTRKRNPTAKILLLDQDTNWSVPEKYDLIIHFGVLCHLENWQQDLSNTIKNANYVALESAINKFVNDVSFKIEYTHYIHEYHGPFNETGSLPSVSLIEKQIGLNQFTRYDDAQLNLTSSEGFFYDAEPTETFLDSMFTISDFTDSRVYGGCKFWIIENTTS
jgi:2-polyprenyl-3-methyl-5-hydroxy-6-metoxy-1,4-benzoquinol methylase